MQDKIHVAKKNARRRKRGTTASDEEYLQGSDSDDDFYDRTISGVCVCICACVHANVYKTYEFNVKHLNSGS